MLFRTSRISLSAAPAQPAVGPAVSRAFSVLGLSVSHSSPLTASELKAAYIRRASIVHPDVNDQLSQSTQAFQELGEALSVAMNYVQKQSRQAHQSPTASSSSSSAVSRRDEHLRDLEHLAAQRMMTNSVTAGRNETVRDMLKAVVDGCGSDRSHLLRINPVADELATRLCSKRSFDSVVMFPKDGASPSEMSRAFSVLVAVLPNIVARLRRSKSPTASSSASPSACVDAAVERDAMQAAHRFGFQPLVLIGTLVVVAGELSPTAGMLASELEQRAIDEIVKSHHPHPIQQQQQQQHHQQQSDVNQKNLLSGNLVTDELTCIISLDDVLDLNSPHVAASKQASFAARSKMLDAAASAFAVWQLRSALRLRAENRLLTAVRTLGLELGGVFPQLSTATDLSRTQKQVEESAAFVESLLSEASDGALEADAREALCEAALRLSRHMPDLLAPEGKRNGEPSSSLSSGNILETCSIVFSDRTEQQQQPLRFTLRRCRTACRVEDQRFDLKFFLRGDGDDRPTLATVAELFLNAARVLEDEIASCFSRVPSAVQERDSIPVARCFGRVFGMPAREEVAFWQRHVKRRAEFLAEHRGRIGSIDLHFLSDDAVHENSHCNSNSSSSSVPHSFVGWCDGGPDGEKVTLDKSILGSDAAFDAWLEDAVAQCTLSRQAQMICSRFSLHYVSRDRNLLLPHFIAFLSRYSVDTHARQLIESSALSGGSQLELIVGHRLDVQLMANNTYGALCIPWDFDLSQLVSLLKREENAALAS